MYICIQIRITMNRCWKRLIVRSHCELKTAQQLEFLNITYRLPMTEVTIDGILHPQIVKNGSIMVLVNSKEEHTIQSLPYVITLKEINDSDF